jgi:hypothetical protein
VRAILLAAALAGLSASAATPAPFAWKNVNIQGMGYVSGLVIHPLPPYDIYIRTDVGGAYRYDRDAGRWLPLLDRADTVRRPACSHRGDDGRRGHCHGAVRDCRTG